MLCVSARGIVCRILSWEDRTGRLSQVVVCPHCGAENAEGSAFCSLCLAGLAAGNGNGAASAHGNGAGPRDAGTQAAAQPYVSPGDYRALAQEMAQQPGGYVYDAPPSHGAAALHGGGYSGMRLTALTPRIGKTEVAIMLLSYSFLTFLVLFVLRFLIGILLLGAAFGGSEAGFNIGVALLFISDALVLAVGGYTISSRAMQRGRGWMFGTGCAACVVFLWQPLVSLVLILVMTGEVYVPLFTLAGLLFTLFLELPMGALGGWFAEKRLIG